jgi:hypothetical protein
LKELDNIKLKWPQEYILNSRAHSNRFGNLSLLQTSNSVCFANVDDLDIFDNTRSKLLFSGI